MEDQGAKVNVSWEEPSLSLNGDDESPLLLRSVMNTHARPDGHNLNAAFFIVHPTFDDVDHILIVSAY